MGGFEVPILLEYVATLTWAISGAVVGMRKRFDLTGIFVIALLSSLGGGLLRDGFFLHRAPAALTNPVYLPLVLVAVVLVALFGRRLIEPQFEATADWIVTATDAVGTPAFALIGMQLALIAGIPWPGVVLIGMVNGTGGGLLRDIVVNELPAVLKPGNHFASVLFLVCIGYLAFTGGQKASDPLVGWFVVAVFVLLRGVVLYFDFRTKPLV